MDIVKRICQLNDTRGWTIYRLAREARVAPSTLTNMIHRGTSPSLSTLERLCNAYGITLAQFFCDYEERIQLTQEQREHLEVWNRLTDRQKRAVNLFIQGLLQIEQEVR